MERYSWLTWFISCEAFFRHSNKGDLAVVMDMWRLIKEKKQKKKKKGVNSTSATN